MKQGLLALAFLALVACDPADRDENPRDRKGSEGPLTWRLVAKETGEAAFLARPGAAPDVVLWCDGDGSLTLRAHIFLNPQPNPDLILKTASGAATFANVRRQGGVRAGDRKLVEGTTTFTGDETAKVLKAADSFVLTSGGVDYRVSAADPDKLLPHFVDLCAGQK